MKIIDSHIHICKYINGFGGRGELIPIGNGMVEYADGKKFRIIPEGMGDYGFSLETAIKVLDENNVDKAVILQGNYLGYQNLYAYEAMMKYKDRIVAAATFDPFAYEKESIVNHLFNELGFKIIKLECSSGSGFMANHKFSLDCLELQYIYNLARIKGITVVMDIGRPDSVSYQVDKLCEMVKKYSDVTFVICHLMAHQMGQLDLLKENLPKFKLPNVYFDLASVINNTKEEYPYEVARSYVREAINIVGSDHIMFGTDMPSGIKVNSYKQNIDFIKNTNLFSEKEKEDIFYNTANHVYFNDK